MIQKLLLSLVRAYRFFLSPWLGSACRFEPTCSMYAIQSLQAHGAAVGSYLAVKRIIRCNPWCEGGCDPVPAARSGIFALKAVSSTKNISTKTPHE